jgi:hypothetical protein
MRANLEAFAAGINARARAHPEALTAAARRRTGLSSVHRLGRRAALGAGAARSRMAAHYGMGLSWRSAFSRAR